MQKLRLGYAGVAISSYFAEEHHQYQRAINGLEALSKEWGFELVPIRHGLLDGEMAERAASELAAQKVDFLLLQNAACSMGEQLIPLSKAAPRLGLWATPDPEQEGEIRIHSVVSMSQYASILKRYLRHHEVPFKWFYGHVEEPAFQHRLGITVRALTAIKNLGAAKIGWIGGLSPGFHDLVFDERKIEARLGGTRVFAHELAEVIALAKSLQEKEVMALVGDIKAAASEVRVSDEALGKGGRVYLALKELAQRNGYSALAVECWPKFQAMYDLAPCMAYSWLGSEDGMAVACEGDVLGALSMLLLNLLTGKEGSSTLLDMTALDPEAGMMLMWHCGVSPRHFANAEGIKWVDHTTLGRNADDGPYGVSADLVFGAQETTVTYIGDSGGTLLVLHSQVVERQVKGFDGTRGWFTQFELNQEPIDLWDLINTLTVRGHEHHYAVGQGDVTSELLEVAAWLKMHPIEKIPYRDYLQREGVNL
jgi:L-fucose isomerase-like protein